MVESTRLVKSLVLRENILTINLQDTLWAPEGFEISEEIVTQSDAQH